MNYISDILFWISTGLLVPVIILLVVLFLRALLLMGSFLGHFIAFKKAERLCGKRWDKLGEADLEEWLCQLPEDSDMPLIRTLHQLWAHRNSEAQVNRLLDEYFIESEQHLSVAKMLAKMGPMLGLMGTLIPMGPALVGLSEGDIASMAYNMQVAFATTVVGLFSAAVGFVTLHLKQGWYQRDMMRLEFIAGLLDEKRKRQ